MKHCDREHKSVFEVVGMYESAPKGPWFFLGIVHPPPTPELHKQLPEGYPFTLAELYKLEPKIPGVTVQVEHAGIHDALDSTTGPDGQLATRETVIAKLHDLGESDATNSPVGKVTYAKVVQPSGALYVILEISQGLEWVSWLVRNGFLTGLSLTTLETSHGIRPYEVSLTKEPARPHCYIVFHSTDEEKVRAYLGRVQQGDVRDYSAILRRPYRIMAASAEKMEVETPAPAAAEAPMEVTAERIMEAIGKHPEESHRKLLMASIEKMTQKALEEKKKAEEAEAARVAAVAKAEAATKTGKLNAAMLESSLLAVRRDLPAEIPYNDELAHRALTSDNIDDVRAGYGQLLITASMRSMLERRDSVVESSSPRKRRNDGQLNREDAEEEMAETDKAAAVAPEETDRIHTQMKTLNSLLVTASADKMPKAAAAPAAAAATSSIPLAADTAEAVSNLKLATALQAFEPLE